MCPGVWLWLLPCGSRGLGKREHWPSRSWSYRQLWVGRHRVLCNSCMSPYSLSQSLQPCQQVKPSYQLYSWLCISFCPCALRKLPLLTNVSQPPTFSYVTPPYGYNSQFKEVCTKSTNHWNYLTSPARKKLLSEKEMSPMAGELCKEH